MLFFGDSGTGSEDQLMVGRGMAEQCTRLGGCDLALVLGDNIYPRGVKKRTCDDPDFRFLDRFELAYQELGRTDMWMVPGNHDWLREGSVDCEVNYTRVSPRWRMPAHDFSVPLLPDWLHIYGLDTTSIAQKRDTGQTGRAIDALCETQGWRLLVGHHPIFSSGRHTSRKGIDPVLSVALVGPVIEACSVQFYLSGHEHHQELLSSAHFEQVVQGAAAKLRPPTNPPHPSVGATPVLPAAETLGFGIIEVDPGSLTIRFFGCGSGSGCREHACRRYDATEFDTAEPRSKDCTIR